MKKNSILAIAAAMLLTLTACGGSNSSSGSSVSSSSESSSSLESSSAVSSEQSSLSSSSSESSSAVTDSLETPDINSEEYIAKVRAMYEGTGEYASMPMVTIETSMGNIKVRLFPGEAPKAVENFLTHAKEGYYDGVSFHRVINDFMIQGGDPEGTGRGGESIWGETFEIEYTPYLFPFRGSLSMANAGPGTNGSQFYIVQCPDIEKAGFTAELLEQFGFPSVAREIFEKVGGYPSLDLTDPQRGMYGYTKFGYVAEGMDVVDKIAAVETGENDKPVEDVTIIKMTVEE